STTVTLCFRESRDRNETALHPHCAEARRRIRQRRLLSELRSIACDLWRECTSRTRTKALECLRAIGWSFYRMCIRLRLWSSTYQLLGICFMQPYGVMAFPSQP